jgi:hypothetical protein
VGRLLERVHQDGQTGGVPEHRREVAAVVRAGVGHPHGVLPGRGEDRDGPPGEAAGGRLGDAEQEAEDGVRRVHPEPDDGEEDAVRGLEAGGASAADGAVPVGPVVAGEVGVVEGREDVGEEGVEHVRGEAGEGPEDGRVLPKAVEACDHGATGAGS